MEIKYELSMRTVGMMTASEHKAIVERWEKTLEAQLEAMRKAIPEVVYCVAKISR